jgi:signal transduction histidine kinase
VHIKTVGREKAMADFNAGVDGFKSGELYVMVYDHTGMNFAHGGNPKLVGKNLIELKDAEGKLIVKGLLDTAAGGKSGWFDYKWPNPVTKAVEAKSTYVENASGDLVVGVGIYK